jgi:hypothetical protein
MKINTIINIARAFEALSIWAIGYPILHHFHFQSWEMFLILSGTAFLWPSKFNH